MIDTSPLENCTWRVVKDGISKGTAFFVSENLLITSLHVVKGYENTEFTIERANQSALKIVVQSICEKNDLAILKVEDYSSNNFVTLCSEEPLLESEWSAFGYPITDEGLKVGNKISGTLYNVVTQEHQHDLVLLFTPGFNTQGDYRGTSGSGVINQKGQVTSVLRYKDTSNICSVSVKKAEKFLTDNGLSILEDVLDDFSFYKPTAFQHLGDFKEIALAAAEVVSNNTSPQKITSTLTGKLMMPTKEGDLKTIIGYLKKEKVINDELWRSWLEFLSFVELLKGKYSEIEEIHVTLEQADISKLVPDIETNINQDITLTLQFYFTEEKEYFSVVRKHIINKSFGGGLDHNHCHIFHSHNPMFSVRLFTKEDKKKIIQNISSPGDPGLSIVESIDYGVLSFYDLTRIVAGSNNLSQAKENLKKILTDAIS